MRWNAYLSVTSFATTAPEILYLSPVATAASFSFFDFEGSFLVFLWLTDKIIGTRKKKYTVNSLEIYVLLIMSNIYLLEIKREMQNYKTWIFACFLFHIYWIFCVNWLLQSIPYLLH